MGLIQLRNQGSDCLPQVLQIPAVGSLMQVRSNTLRIIETKQVTLLEEESSKEEIWKWGAEIKPQSYKRACSE